MEWSKKNWTNGCLRKEILQCEMIKNNGSKEEKSDGFVKVEMAKVPDFVGWSPSKDVLPATDGDCRTPCLNNYSCIAFAYDAGVGCMFWSSELHDLRKFSYGGVDLYVRLAYAELGMNLFFCGLDS
jgi:hypothetical protein